jgi:16S rRNA (adenine1518-N6/adenine1519-N6)-dimethyltransferase
VEKDARCLAILEDLKKVADGRLEIVHADALEFDPTAVPAPRKIVANLPYNAGTQMLINWMELVYTHGQDALSSLTLMFQKEVAERIVASHGSKDYGRLSVLCQWLCDVRYDMELPPGAFSPPPKVSSAVITLTPREKPLVDVSKETLEKVIGAAFGQRRKMLRSALKALGTDAEKLLAAAGIDPTLRAEQVDLIGLCHLAKTYEKTRK